MGKKRIVLLATNNTNNKKQSKKLKVDDVKVTQQQNNNKHNIILTEEQRIELFDELLESRRIFVQSNTGVTNSVIGGPEFFTNVINELPINVHDLAKIKFNANGQIYNITRARKFANVFLPVINNYLYKITNGKFGTLNINNSMNNNNLVSHTIGGQAIDNSTTTFKQHNMNISLAPLPMSVNTRPRINLQPAFSTNNAQYDQDNTPIQQVYCNSGYTSNYNNSYNNNVSNNNYNNINNPYNSNYNNNPDIEIIE